MASELFFICCNFSDVKSDDFYQEENIFGLVAIITFGFRELQLNNNIIRIERIIGDPLLLHYYLTETDRHTDQLTTNLRIGQFPELLKQVYFKYRIDIISLLSQIKMIAATQRKIKHITFTRTMTIVHLEN